MATRESRHPLVVSGVVGDVLDPFTSIVNLHLTTDGGKVIFNGCSLRPSNVVAPPTVEIGCSDLQAFYALVMVDPDAPSPSNPQFKEYLHWLVIDIPAGRSGSGYGNEVVSYERPQPTMGIHRLVVVLFRQKGHHLAVGCPQQRQNFCTREFSRTNNLGAPVAALYYNCQRENGTGGRRNPI